MGNRFVAFVVAGGERSVVSHPAASSSQETFQITPPNIHALVPTAPRLWPSYQNRRMIEKEMPLAIMESHCRNYLMASTRRKWAKGRMVDYLWQVIFSVSN
jgi:hypothetical protein